MSRFVPCKRCGAPAREVGWPADCAKCGKVLCEECCDRAAAGLDHYPAELRSRDEGVLAAAHELVDELGELVESLTSLGDDDGR